MVINLVSYTFIIATKYWYKGTVGFKFRCLTAVLRVYQESVVLVDFSLNFVPILFQTSYFLKTRTLS